jgi:GNAT superfamily N-acetyltransferase
MANAFRKVFDRLADRLLPFAPLLAEEPAALDRVFNPDDWDGEVRAVALHHVTNATVAGAAVEWRLARPRTSAASSPKAAVEPAVIDLPPNVSRAVNRYVQRTMSQSYWDDLTDSVRDDLRGVLRRGLRDGSSPAQIADRVRDALGPSANAARSKRIARTEATGALNAGAEAARGELAREGLVEGKEWMSVLDKDTRYDHDAANGQRVGAGKKFTIGGERCLYPGDTALSPAQRCNCRCTVVTVYAEGVPAEPPENQGTGEPVPDDDTLPGEYHQPSRAEVTLDPDVTREQVLAAVKEMFDGSATLKDMASLVGAPDDARVTVGIYKGKLEVGWESPAGSASRTFRKVDGVPEVENVHFILEKEHQGTGLGTAVLAKQIAHATRHGLSKIKTYAAGNFRSIDTYNGYYTWPRFGYDAPLDEWTREKLPATLADAGRLSDLMKTPEGREWWKVNGEDGDMEFDLRAGSLSRKVFAEYLRRKKGKGTPATAKGTRKVESPDLTDDEGKVLDSVWDDLEVGR